MTEPEKPDLLRLETGAVRRLECWLMEMHVRPDTALLAEILAELRQLTLVVADIREFLRPGEEEHS